MNLERIKDHVRKHKVVYSCGATAVVTAVFTTIIMRGRYAVLRGGADGDLILNELIVRPLNFFSHHNNATNNIVTVIEREGRGHPGYLVRCLETNEIFSSQQKTSEFFKIPESVLSDHLRGKFDNANGLHFERIGIAS